MKVFGTYEEQIKKLLLACDEREIEINNLKNHCDEKDNEIKNLKNICDEREIEINSLKNHCDKLKNIIIENAKNGTWYRCVYYWLKNKYEKKETKNAVGY